MSAKILITGATGTLGRALVPVLQNAGAELRLLSRSEQPNDDLEWVRGDVSTGEGLDAAVRDVRTVVHCAGSQQGDADKARHLVGAATAAGVEHIVHVSVVGADRIPVVSRVDRSMFGYFAAKREAEDVIMSSPIPWTMLRPTQFHSFVVDQLDQLSKVPLLLPVFKGVSFQPVDVDDVAQRLTELALGDPAGMAPPLAGPRIYPFDQLARDYLAATGKRRVIVNMPVPGQSVAAFRAGANLAPDHATGTGAWEAYLARRFPGRLTMTPRAAEQA
ncbi:MAG TPA: SDR family oxidoreductase [Microlunatus sp.]